MPKSDGLGIFEIGSELLYSFENKMFNGNQDVDDYRSIIKEWAAENQDCVVGLTQ